MKTSRRILRDWFLVLVVMIVIAWLFGPQWMVISWPAFGALIAFIVIFYLMALESSFNQHNLLAKVVVAGSVLTFLTMLFSEASGSILITLKFIFGLSALISLLATLVLLMIYNIRYII